MTVLEIHPLFGTFLLFLPHRVWSDSEDALEVTVEVALIHKSDGVGNV